MRQACGGPPALSQINHAADPRSLCLGAEPCPHALPITWPRTLSPFFLIFLSSTSSFGEEQGGGERPVTPRFASFPVFLYSSFCGVRREKQKRLSHLPSVAAATTALFITHLRARRRRPWFRGWGGRIVCHGPSTLAWKQLTDVSVHRRTANAIVASTCAVLGTSF